MLVVVRTGVAVAGMSKSVPGIAMAVFIIVLVMMWLVFALEGVCVHIATIFINLPLRSHHQTPFFP